MRSVLIANGPNLNLLGSRENQIYGPRSLETIEASCRKAAAAMELTIEFMQSNHEGELVDIIQSAGTKHAGIIINPAAYTHTSIAIHDALRAVALPVIEIHLTNIHRRESFRLHSYVSPVADGVICGLGAQGYLLALTAMADLINNQNMTA